MTQGYLSALYCVGDYLALLNGTYASETVLLLQVAVAFEQQFSDHIAQIAVFTISQGQEPSGHLGRFKCRFQPFTLTAVLSAKVLS